LRAFLKNNLKKQKKLLKMETIILNFRACYIILLIKKNPKFFGIVESRHIIASIKDLALYHPDKNAAANIEFKNNLFAKFQGTEMYKDNYDVDMDIKFFNLWGYKFLINELRKAK
jgi:hypothetical protein